MELCCGEAAPRAGDRDAAGRLLLWALRRCAFGCGDPRVVEAALCDACGAEAGRLAYVGLRSFLTVLALYGRRRLRLGPPGYAGATHDERALLALFAAAQAGAAAELDARLAWLVRPDPAVDARRVADATAAALGRGGVVLVPARIRPIRGQGAVTNPSATPLSGVSDLGGT